MQHDVFSSMYLTVLCTLWTPASTQFRERMHFWSSRMISAICATWISFPSSQPQTEAWPVYMQYSKLPHWLKSFDRLEISRPAEVALLIFLEGLRSQFCDIFDPNSDGEQDYVLEIISDFVIDLCTGTKPLLSLRDGLIAPSTCKAPPVRPQHLCELSLSKSYKMVIRSQGFDTHFLRQYSPK